MTDRRSTRVHAAPGGTQTFNIFGGGPAEAPAPPTAQPAPVVSTDGAAMPVAGQRVLQRTEHMGVSADGHMSSRVLNAPGGHQQFNIFSGEAEPVVAPKPQQVAVMTTDNTSMPVAGQRVLQRTEHMGVSADGHMSSRVLHAPGGHQQFNIFSGEAEPAAAPKPQQAPVMATGGAAMPVAGQRVVQRTEHMGIMDGHMSSRVLATPGGQSEMASIVGGSTASDRIAAMKARREAAAPLAEATNNATA